MWWTLEDRQKKAEKYPLKILIFGPNNGGSIESNTLCKLRDELRMLGHTAAFWEELCSRYDAQDEVVQEIILQALEAHLIVIIYCSSCLQSKHKVFMDELLSNRSLAAKSIVFVDESVYTSLEESLTLPNWEQISLITQVYPYSKSNLPDHIIDQVLATIQKLRRQVYVRGVLRGEIF